MYCIGLIYERESKEIKNTYRRNFEMPFFPIPSILYFFVRCPFCNMYLMWLVSVKCLSQTNNSQSYYFFSHQQSVWHRHVSSAIYSGSDVQLCVWSLRWSQRLCAGTVLAVVAGMSHVSVSMLFGGWNAATLVAEAMTSLQKVTGTQTQTHTDTHKHTHRHTNMHTHTHTHTHLGNLGGGGGGCENGK